MAQLAKKAYDFTRTAGGDWMDRAKEEEAELKRLYAAAAAVPDGQVVGRIIGLPMADGHALYLVQSEKPLVLQHIPFFDGYAVDAAMIRGLRLDDVVRRVGVSRLFR